MDIFSTLPYLWKILWPLVVAFVFVAIFIILFEIVIPDLINAYKNKRRFAEGKKWRSDRELLKWLQKMSPTNFEKYIAELFNNLGYSAEAVGRSHDGGIDVKLEKDGRRSYVQCKKYMSSTVSVSEVRDFYGALADHVSDGQGFFVTTNKFTLEAQKFAEDKPIELIDGVRLVEYIRLSEKNSFSNEVPTVVANDLCPKCNSSLIERDGKFGKFLGCEAYPKCDFTRSI